MVLNLSELARNDYAEEKSLATETLQPTLECQG